MNYCFIGVFGSVILFANFMNLNLFIEEFFVLIAVNFKSRFRRRQIGKGK